MTRRGAARAAALLLTALAGAAATARPAPERSAREILAEHCRAREALSTLRTRFEQVRVFTALGDEERSSGVFYYRKPDSIRWEYTQPDRSFTVVKGGKGWAVFPGIRQVRRLALDGARLEGILSTVGFGPCGPGFAASFETTVSAAPAGAVVLSMKPLRPDVAAQFTEIELILDRRDHLPRAVVLNETTGDRIRLDFLDLRRDQRLQASLFEFAPPEDYEVVN